MPRVIAPNSLHSSPSSFVIGAEKSSPVGGKPRAVPRPRDEGGKVWLKPESKEDKEGGEAPKEEEPLVNGFGSDEHSEEHSVQPGMTGDEQPQINGEHGKESFSLFSLLYSLHFITQQIFLSSDVTSILAFILQHINL